MMESELVLTPQQRAALRPIAAALVMGHKVSAEDVITAMANYAARDGASPLQRAELRKALLAYAAGMST